MNFTDGIRCAKLAAAVCITAASIAASPLEIWKQQFFNTAQLFDSIQSSPSSMFWDETRGGGIGSPKLWETRDTGNYLHLEPAVQGHFSNNKDFEDGSSVAFSGDLVIDVRFKNFFIRQTLDVDSRYNEDNDKYRWKTDRGAAGRIAEAYLQVNHHYGFFRLGRLKRNWGPFVDRSVILSSNPHTYDAFEWQLAGSFFEFRHLFSAFPYARSQYDTKDPDGTGPQIQRYFTAHSLNLMIKDWVVLGITETVIFGRKNGFPDFQYINPFSIYTVTNTNGEGTGNLMLGFQWKIYPFTKKIAIKGQVCIDDIQVDNEDVADQEPSHWAGDFEIALRNPLKIKMLNALSFNYRYLSRFVYLVDNNNTSSGERYTYLEKGLGYPRNDGDRWSVNLDIINQNWWMARVGAAYGRNGGNGIDSSWNTDEGYNGYRRETILRSDSAEHVIELYLNGSAYFAPFVALHVGINNQWIKNKGNKKTSAFEYDPRVYLELTLQYPGYYWKF